MTVSCIQDHLIKNQLEYSSISIRFSAEIRSGSNTDSFRGNIRILKDSIIWISVRSLNIEGARLLITQDSVRFINRIDNNYFTGEVSSLKTLFNIDINYNTLQALLTNSFFYYPDNNGNVEPSKTFDVCNSPDFFCMQSVQNFSPVSPDKNINENRSETEISAENSHHQHSTVQRVKVYPEIFKPAEMYIENRYLGQSINVIYNNLFKINDSDYFPKNIEIELISPQIFIALILSVDNIIIDRESLSFPFSIPERYEPLLQNDRK